MNTRRIRVKSNIVTPQRGGFLIKSKNTALFIPASFILKTNKQDFFESKKKNPWNNFYLEPDFLKNRVVLLQLSRLKKQGKLFVYGKRSHGIHWDHVLSKVYSRPQDMCFFCDEELVAKENKTKDHLVPTVIVKAFGYNYIEDNTVPCCKECNEEKASLHPAYFRVKAKRLSKHSDKWLRVYKTLNKILIDKKNPYE